MKFPLAFLNVRLLDFRPVSRLQMCGNCRLSISCAASIIRSFSQALGRYRIHFSSSVNVMLPTLIQSGPATVCGVTGSLGVSSVTVCGVTGFLGVSSVTVCGVTGFLGEYSVTVCGDE